MDYQGEPPICYECVEYILDCFGYKMPKKKSMYTCTEKTCCFCQEKKIFASGGLQDYVNPLD